LSPSPQLAKETAKAEATGSTQNCRSRNSSPTLRKSEEEKEKREAAVARREKIREALGRLPGVKA
jgi:hypothetical protein